MKIVNVVCAPGRTGFFFDDQKAIKSGAKSDGAAYIGQPVTSGFKSIRQAGESISVMLVLEDGQIAWGDCAAVQYSGAGGRDPLFLAEDFIPVIDKYIKPALVGKEADSFRELTKMMEAIEVDGKRLHTAIRYGVSQAILDAVAKSSKRLMSEVVADEWCNTLEDVIYFCDNKAGHMAQIKTPDLGGINNTIEAVLYCKEHGFGAYQGGTCNETDRSCQVCVDCAMATQPDQILAKPGMGVDEGFMIVYNEMNRVIALRNAKKC